MSYRSLEECLNDLERHGHLVRIREEVDPDLELAAIQLKVYEQEGPALLFENVKGSRFRAASNIFGTLDRSRFIFRDTLETVKKLIRLKDDPLKAAKHPLQNLDAALAAWRALPLRNPAAKPVLAQEIAVTDMPLIRHWPGDGGAFITLPQVYSEDADKPGIMHSNLGMYRIQLNGNSYETNREIGLHYQIHRGIGVHQHKAIAKGEPLKVSIFVGGPPAHTLSAVMPLPEGLSEINFAGVLGGRKFRYFYKDGYCISADADFVITGLVHAGVTKPEGPFGDHLGYYSLAHDFPVMEVKKVYAREQAIWPFTVVGRPPQEDTSFGALIHELTGNAIPQEIPGLKDVNAVDAAGVHPLLLATGSERYTPYTSGKRPAELLTIANHILGTGQLSLAKYLLIAADEAGRLDTHDISRFFRFVLERADWRRDLHFQTQTTIDTLDYSGTGLNMGSKLVIAATGDPVRELTTEIPAALKGAFGWAEPRLVMPGVLALRMGAFVSYEHAGKEMNALDEQLRDQKESMTGLPLLIICDDSDFLGQTLNNFLWATFTRSNPSHDVYGVETFCEHKHWGCRGSLIIDARLKPHHAPVLEQDPQVLKKIQRIFDKGGSLYGKLK
ncbi:MAG: UbiD family decarboxylase [Sphingobacteriales bacterium]|nr:MAG: UbiD family decarboxylase [Sphingobacteriales bacterium]